MCIRVFSDDYVVVDGETPFIGRVELNITVPPNNTRCHYDPLCSADQRLVFPADAPLTNLVVEGNNTIGIVVGLAQQFTAVTVTQITSLMRSLLLCSDITSSQ